MDLKFISQTKLLFFYGIIGFVFSTIVCIIETSVKCVGDDIDLFCHVYSNNDNNSTNGTNIGIHISYNQNITTNTNNTNNKNIKYIENFFIFIEDFSKLNSKEIANEIVITLTGIILYYFSLYFDILIINYLTPMHFTF